MICRSVTLRRAARLAAAAVGGCVLLAGCGTVQMGAAAIMAGQRISVASLASQVSALSRYYQGEGQKVQLAFPVSQLPQQVLSWLVRFQVRDQLGRRQGISVTPAQQQQAIRQITAQVRQSSGTPTLTQVAVAHGLPPDMITEFGTYLAIETVLLNRLDGGHAPSTATAQQALGQAFNHYECLAAKSLNIKINPQFGRVDYASLSIVPAPSMLSAPGPGTTTPAPSASAPPRFTPPC